MSSGTSDDLPLGAGKQDRKGAPRRKTSSGTDEVGKALRSAYDEALREDVPDDFLDLLGKLN